MAVFRTLTRRLALVLLLGAAIDLSYPACCADAESAGSTRATLGVGEHQADAGHGCEDCLCCSRTVRTEGTVSLDHLVVTTVVASGAPAGLFDVLAPPPYHPPLT